MDTISAQDTGLLLKAFESFTQASSSLESAFEQLQSRARSLSEELEARNIELQRSLREKEEVEQFLQTVLERLPCGVVVLDEAGSVILSNPAAAGILGEPPGGRLHRRKRSRRRCALLRDRAASIAAGSAGREIEIPLARGDETRTLALSGTPLTDGLGRASGSLHIMRDITELKALEEQGKRVERLSAMGEMAVELAHEIRNPLGSIELFASMLEKELPARSDSARWAENIRIGSRSLNNIVSNMLHFANPLAPVFARVDLHEAIDETVQFTAPILRQRDVALELALAAHAPVVMGDRELLKQMTLNLLLNSMQAMPAKGSLRIETAVLQDAVQLRVSDTGVGIAPENLKRIFDPFFTTSRKGTGLGLSVVHQIVEGHGGSIQVESAVNVGTTFAIVLPRAVGSVPRDEVSS